MLLSASTERAARWLSPRRWLIVLVPISIVLVGTWYVQTRHTELRLAAVERLVHEVKKGSSGDVDAAVISVKRFHATEDAIPELIACLKGCKLNGEVPDHYANAMSALVQLGPSVVPSLLNVMDDPEYRQAAGSVIQALGKEAITELVRALENSSDSQTRIAAVRMLSTLTFLKFDTTSAVPALRRSLQSDENDTVRANTAITLSFLGPKAKSALPELITALRHSNKFVRLGAAGALAKIDRNKAPLALPVLERLLNDPNEAVRFNAAFSIGDFEKSAQSALTSLLKQLNDRQQTVRASVVSAISRITSGEDIVIKCLIREFHNDRSKGYRWRIIDALEACGPNAKEAVPLLVKALKNPDLKPFSLKALRQIEPSAAKQDN